MSAPTSYSRDEREPRRAGRWVSALHLARTGNRSLGKVRPRVQNEILGHRGRKADPLYRIRKLLLSAEERLDEAGTISCCSACGRVIPPTRCWGHGWPRSR
ncbi:MAG: transposase [Actinomycetota bacterium]|nr:transposase [Actinomycetota bacterium]